MLPWLYFDIFLLIRTIILLLQFQQNTIISLHFSTILNSPPVSPSLPVLWASGCMLEHPSRITGPYLHKRKQEHTPAGQKKNHMTVFAKKEANEENILTVFESLEWGRKTQEGNKVTALSGLILFPSENQIKNICLRPFSIPSGEPVIFLNLTRNSLYGKSDKNKGLWVC